jgi:hypothetical protein
MVLRVLLLLVAASTWYSEGTCNSTGSTTTVVVLLVTRSTVLSRVPDTSSNSIDLLLDHKSKKFGTSTYRVGCSAIFYLVQRRRRFNNLKRQQSKLFVVEHSVPNFD